MKCTDDVLEKMGFATQKLKEPRILTFDEIIENKKNNKYIKYFETIIGISGEIYEVTPAHVYTLMYLAGFKTQDEAYDTIPVDNDVLHWLIEKSNCVAVWYDFCYAKELNADQGRTLTKLISLGIVNDDYTVKLIND